MYLIIYTLRARDKERRQGWEDKKELTCTPSTTDESVSLTNAGFKIIASEGHSLQLE